MAASTEVRPKWRGNYTGVRYPMARGVFGVRPFEFRSFAKEDFATEAPWLERLIRPLNSILSQVRAGLQNGLTLSENLNAEVKTLDVTAKEDWTNLSITSPWTTGSPTPRARKRGIRVELQGCVTRNTAVSGNSLTTLSANYRPALYGEFAGGSGATPYSLGVNTDGTCPAYFTGTPTSVFLDGIAFDASDSTGGVNPAFPISFKTKVRGRASGLVVLRVVELSGRDEIAVGSAVSADWSQDAASVQLKGITGLVPGKKYRATLLVVGS